MLYATSHQLTPQNFCGYYGLGLFRIRVLQHKLLPVTISRDLEHSDADNIQPRRPA